MKFRTNSTVHLINFAYSHSQYLFIEYFLGTNIQQISEMFSLKDFLDLLHHDQLT